MRTWGTNWRFGELEWGFHESVCSNDGDCSSLLPQGKHLRFSHSLFGLRAQDRSGAICSSVERSQDHYNKAINSEQIETKRTCLERDRELLKASHEENWFPLTCQKYVDQVIGSHLRNCSWRRYALPVCLQCAIRRKLSRNWLPSCCSWGPSVVVMMSTIE